MAHRALALTRIPGTVESADVPQANLLPRVIEMTQARMTFSCADGVPGFEHVRDRAYYTRAAQVLGLLDRYSAPTLLGRRIVRAEPAEAHALLRFAFERSDVGAAWMYWAGASSTSGICGSTSEAFLTDCTTLSSSTAHRRAKTLRRWVEYLQAKPTLGPYSQCAGTISRHSKS